MSVSISVSGQTQITDVNHFETEMRYSANERLGRALDECRSRISILRAQLDVVAPGARKPTARVEGDHLDLRPQISRGRRGAHLTLSSVREDAERLLQDLKRASSDLFSKGPSNR